MDQFTSHFQNTLLGALENTSDDELIALLREAGCDAYVGAPNMLGLLDGSFAEVDFVMSVAVNVARANSDTAMNAMTVEMPLIIPAASDYAELALAA